MDDPRPVSIVSHVTAHRERDGETDDLITGGYMINGRIKTGAGTHMFDVGLTDAEPGEFNDPTARVVERVRRGIKENI